MRHFVIALSIPVLVAAFAATAHTAAAAGPATDQQYKEAMAPFAPVIRDFRTRVEQSVDSAVIKPELGCNVEMREFVQIADGMVADLDGTAKLAPARLTSAQEGLTGSVARIGDAAALSCGNPKAAATQLRTERELFDFYLSQIEAFTRVTDENV